MFVTATEGYVTNTNSVLYTTVECSKAFGMAHGALENDCIKTEAGIAGCAQPYDLQTHSTCDSMWYVSHCIGANA